MTEEQLNALMVLIRAIAAEEARHGGLSYQYDPEQAAERFRALMQSPGSD